MRLTFLRLTALALLCLHYINASAQESEIHLGARIYLERCALCHGSKGLGEGPMALLVHGYPDTRLKKADVPYQSTRRIVEFGSPPELEHSLSPPWRDELPAQEIAAVTRFVEELRIDFGHATEVLASIDIPPESIDGRKIYRARCESCHGVAGNGDGRMSRVIRNPPPSDLTRSTLSYEETIAIVSAGGQALGKSPRMPPWGQELIGAELLSVANYIVTLRINSTDK